MIRHILTALLVVALMTGAFTGVAMAETTTATPTTAPAATTTARPASTPAPPSSTSAPTSSEKPGIADACTSTVLGCLEAIGDGISDATETITSPISTAVGNAWDAMVQSFAFSASWMLNWALTFWTRLPGEDIDTYQNTLDHVSGYTYYLQYAALVMSVIVLGGRVAMARSGMIRNTSEQALSTLARSALVIGGLQVVMVAGLQLSDGVSHWIITGLAGEAGFADAYVGMEAMLKTDGLQFAGQGAAMILVSIVGFFGGLVMLFLMILRSGLLVVVTAAMPIAAAAGGSRVGAQSFEKLLAWAIAFLLFKPVGSLIIGIALLMNKDAMTREQSIHGWIVSVMLLAACGFVLPALMRLIAPIVGEQLGGGGSGLAATSAALAGMSGAMHTVSDAFGSSGGGGNNPPPPPPGGGGGNPPPPPSGSGTPPSPEPGSPDSAVGSTQPSGSTSGTPAASGNTTGTPPASGSAGAPAASAGTVAAAPEMAVFLV